MRNERKMPYRAKASQADTSALVAAVVAPGSIDPSRSYAEQVFRLLRLAIARTRLPPGTVLSEAGIAEASGLSRTPVREALRQLAQEGLVDVYPQAGTVVAPIRLALLDEARFVRGALEAANFRTLASVVDAKGIAALRAIVGEQRTAMAEGRLGDFMDLDDALHARAFSLGGRPRVWALIDREKIHLDRVRWLLLERLAAHAPRVLEDHEGFCDLLERGDEEGIALAALEHVDKVKRDLLELEASVPAAFFEGQEAR